MDKVQTFVVTVRSMDGVAADDVKTLVQREFEVLDCVEQGADEVVTDRV